VLIGIEVVTIAAIVAAIGGVVAACATVVRLAWEARDRGRKARADSRVTLRTFTMSDLGTEVRRLRGAVNGRGEQRRASKLPVIVAVTCVFAVLTTIGPWVWRLIFD
jgi:hypothetical protein